ncbi:MAG: ABC transporter permease [Planctomycetota bacterium]|jgi:ABC-type antimicrobial peptide transport system permease subunit
MSRRGVILQNSMMAIVRHPLRSFLVTTTFALGLASVVSIVGTIEGGRRAIAHDLDALGSDLVAVINPLRLGSLAVGVATQGRALDSDDIESVRERLRGDVDSVSPVRIDLGLTSTVNGSWRHTMISTTPGFRSVLRPGMLAGRFLSHQDRWSSNPDEPTPAAIDEALAVELFGDPVSAMGQELRSIREGRAFSVQIIGVVKDPLLLRQYMSSFDATSSARSIPARRLQFLNLYLPWKHGQDQPMLLLIDTPGLEQVEEVVEQLEQFIASEKLGVFLHVQKRWVAMVLGIIDRFVGLGHFVWILDLLVVLILTGTISLLAIDESIQEVALRRAEGATVFQVVMPVLLEGAWLSLAAMGPGIVLGMKILEYGIEPILGWPSWLPPTMIGGTCLALLVTALLGSMLPAWRVARLDPAMVLGGRRDL